MFHSEINKILLQLKSDSPKIDDEKVLSRIKDSDSQLSSSLFWNSLSQNIADLRNLRGSLFIDNQGVINISSKEPLSTSEEELLDEIVMSLVPWRNGPISLFGQEIDTEWISQMKWERLKCALGDINGRNIADVGCANGYFLFRLLSKNPRLLLGFDPGPRVYLQFQLMKSFLGLQNIEHLRLGVEDLHLFPSTFHLILFLGVIYHRRDPLEALRILRNALVPRGRLLLESMSIPIDGPYALFPPERYAKMGNVWFLPSEECLYSWLKRSGFVHIEKIVTYEVSMEEQRATRYAPYESLSDFLMPGDISRTIEGFPAPKRSIFSASKK